MKKIIPLLLCLFTIAASVAQSPKAFYNNATQKTSRHPTPTEGGGLATPAPNNPWLVTGVQTSYNILEGGSFEDRFGASGRVILETFRQTPSNGMYIMGNVSQLNIKENANDDQKIKDIMRSAQGINAGLYYYHVFGKADPTKTHFTVYPSLSTKLNAFENQTDQTDLYLLQYRSSVGVEVTTIEGKLTKRPITLSVEGTMSYFNVNSYKKLVNRDRWYLPSLEATLIFPIAPSTGLMLIYNVSRDSKSQISFGAIVTASQLARNE